ncbi:hypothetical protein ABG067_003286 [Albugo candida]
MPYYQATRDHKDALLSIIFAFHMFQVSQSKTKSTEGHRDSKHAASSIDTPPRSSLEPYSSSRKTELDIAGQDFIVISGDRRLSSGYSILYCNGRKLLEVEFRADQSPRCDVIRSRRMLQLHFQVYMHARRDLISLGSGASSDKLALLTSFFPYYAFCLLAGTDNQGKGAVYSDELTVEMRDQVDIY